MTAPGSGDVIGTAFVQVVPLVRDFTRQLRNQLQDLRQLQQQQLQQLRLQQQRQLQALRLQQQQQTQQLRLQQSQLLAQLRQLRGASQQFTQQVQQQQLQQLQALRRQQLGQLQGLQAEQFARLQQLRRQQFVQLQRLQRVGEEGIAQLRRELQLRGQQLGLLERLELRFAGLRDGIRRATRDLRRLNRDLSIVSSGVRALAFAVSGLITALPLAIAGLRALGAISIVGGLLAAAGAATELAGALLVVPAGFVAAAAGAGALAVGLFGVEDAFQDFLANRPEQFAEDLQKLSREARRTLLVLNEFKPALRDFKNAVQDALFLDLAPVLRDLGRALLPRVRANFVAIAEVANRAAREVAAFTLTTQTLADVDTTSRNVVRTFQVMRPAAVNLASAFRDVVVVGSRFLPGIAAQATLVTGVLRERVAELRRTGELQELIVRGLRTLQSALAAVVNFGVGVGAILLTAREAGVGLIEVIQRVSERFRAFTTSIEGRNAIRAFLEDAHGAAAALFPVLRELGELLITRVLPILEDFGRTVAPAVIIVINGIAEALDLAAPGLHDLARGFASMLVALRPALPALGLLLGALATLLGTILEQLGPAIADLVIAISEFLIPIIRGLTRLIEGLSTEQLKWIIIIGGLLVAIGPLLTALRGVFTVISLLVGVIGFLLTPWGLLVAAVALLVIFMVRLWHESETFRDIVRTIGRALKPFFDVLGELARQIGKIFQGLGPLKPLLEVLAKFIGLVLLGLVALFTGVAVILFGILKIMEPIVTVIAQAVEGLVGLVTEALDALGIIEKKTGLVVGEMTRTIGDFFGPVLGEAGSALGGFRFVVQTEFARVAEIVNFHMGQVGSALGSVHEPLENAGSAAIGYQDTTSRAFEAAANAVQSGIDRIKNILGLGTTAIGAAGSAAGFGYVAGLQGAFGAASHAAGSLVRVIGDQLFGADFSAAGAAVTRSFANGMVGSAALAAVRAASREVAGAAGSALPRSPAEVGPFSGRGWTPFRGLALAEGFAEGIRAGRTVVGAAASDLASATSRELNLGFTDTALRTSVGFGAPLGVTRPPTVNVVTPSPGVTTEVRVFVDGRELRGVVTEVVDERDRQLRRGVTSGAGGAR